MHSTLGMIVGRFEAAVKESGMKTFLGPDASMQSPDMSDLLLHEAAVAIFRNRMRVEKPCVVPWKETEAQWAQRKSLIKNTEDRLSPIEDLNGETLVSNAHD